METFDPSSHWSKRFWVCRDKRNGRRVVFTNGCFDLLHPGTSAAWNMPQPRDTLVVGLNSDASVSNSKAGAPADSEGERAEIFGRLECVDGVLIFDDLTHSAPLPPAPRCLCERRRLGRRQDIGREEVEAAGGRVVSAPVVPGYSRQKYEKDRDAFRPAQNPEFPRMILPASASDSKLCCPSSMDGAIRTARGGQHVSLSGLHDVPKLSAPPTLPMNWRPRFLCDRFKSRADALADTLRFSLPFFPSALCGVATLPGSIRFPGSRKPPRGHSRTRAATLFAHDASLSASAPVALPFGVIRILTFTFHLLPPWY